MKLPYSNPSKQHKLKVKSVIIELKILCCLKISIFEEFSIKNTLFQVILSMTPEMMR
jgi:hypothetical protein